MDATLTLVVIDNHEVARKGLVAWCRESDPPINVVATGAAVDTAVHGPGAAADVVLLDLMLVPGPPTLDGLQRLLDDGRRVVVYSGSTNSEIAMECAERGAMAYVTKDETGEFLIEAIRAAAQGRSTTTPILAGAMASDNRPDKPKLSIQEAAALRAWFVSRSKILAAQSMHVSPSAVRTYIERARAKYLAVGRPARTKVEMLQRAVEDGYITLAELASAGDQEPG